MKFVHGQPVETRDSKSEELRALFKVLASGEAEPGTLARYDKLIIDLNQDENFRKRKARPAARRRVASPLYKKIGAAIEVLEARVQSPEVGWLRDQAHSIRAILRPEDNDAHLDALVALERAFDLLASDELQSATEGFPGERIFLLMVAAVSVGHAEARMQQGNEMSARTSEGKNKLRSAPQRTRAAAALDGRDFKSATQVAQVSSVSKSTILRARRALKSAP
jgi:hypothetical protein